MKYLIFSDIHSNIEAFDKLLKLKRAIAATKYLFLGDLVGYGPNPNEVIELYRSLDNVTSVRGNHDKVISQMESSNMFNPVAASSADWSMTELSAANKKTLKNLKPGPVVVDDFITLCHGSTFDEDYYMFSLIDAMQSFNNLKTSIGFFGHTHFPVIFVLKDQTIDTMPIFYNRRIRLDTGAQYLINPGSIGQPRDKNPQAGYLTLDSDTMEVVFIRYTYDYKRTQNKIRGIGLPEILAARLESGI